jgi:ferric-dicitrate binding protein FerR (iron transport regulator)
MNPNKAQYELLLRYLDDRLTQAECLRIVELLRTDPAARAFLREVAEQAVMVADVERVKDQRAGELEARRDWKGQPRQVLGRITGRRTRLAKWPWAVAAAAVIALIASLYFLRPSAERPIAKVTALNGSLQWTGNGGRVFYDLSIGTELPGGTIEGMTPRSWFELEFSDGSTVTISGNSMLTFSDHGQKKLYLKEGNMSGNVKPQPAGQPILIYTRSAMLEVLGTQFEVEAELAATTLNVSEGSVRVKRFSDGSTAVVPAKHRLIAAADREMLPEPVPDSVNRWKSQLPRGPVGTQGRWSPGTDTQDAKIAAMPWTTPQGMTIYTVGFGVSYGDKPPVILQAGSRLRVRGRIGLSHTVYFGVTAKHANGEFAGHFQTIRPAADFPNGQDLEVVLALRDFQPVPSHDKVKDKLPSAPFDLVVEAFWCHTLNVQAGLEVTEVELIPPAEEESE